MLKVVTRHPAWWFWMVAGLLGVSAMVSAQGPLFGGVREALPGDIDWFEAALGDVDGDGDLDALVRGGLNHLLLNDGAGFFSDATAGRLPVISGWSGRPRFGDVDGDGDLDLLLGRLNAQDLLFLNDGTGSFTDVTSSNLPARTDYTADMTFGDVDGDGDIDALIGNYQDQNRLYLNDGSGVFSDVTATCLPVISDSTHIVVLGDVDRDGDLDALVGNHTLNYLHFNDGSGVFTDVTGTNFPSFTGPTSDIALGDVNGDGALDVLMGNSGSHYGSNRLALNDGSGSFTDVTATHMPPLIGLGTRALALGDLDGDGDLDLLLGNGTLEQNRLYVNDGAGVFSDVTLTNLTRLADSTHTLALGDVDGDGDLDAFVGDGDAGSPAAGKGAEQGRLFLNAGPAVLSDVTARSLPSAVEETWAVALGDLDGDGDLDAVLGNEWPGVQNRLYLNDGTGAFDDATNSNLPWEYTSTFACALEDVDGDGDLDVMFGNAGQNRLYLNDGAGSFSQVTATHLPALLGSTWSIAFGDVDGDGDQDALLANLFAQNRLYINDGSGFFTDESAGQLPVDSDYTLAVALGDVDGDGDLDALIGNADHSTVGPPNRLYTNDGGGRFTDVSAAQLPLDTDPTRALAFGDVDGDGDLDAVIGNWFQQQNRLYLNDGAGVFTDATATHYPVDADGTAAIAFGDVDEDGDLDLVIVNGGGPNRLYLNGGTGVFTDATAGNLPTESDLSYALALGDLDGDADLDFFAANAGQNRIYTNLSRQLSWRSIPRFGKPLTIEIYGPAGEPWILGAAMGTGQIPSPSWGVLRLELASLLVLDQGILDANGGDAVTYSIPANPGGATGLTLYGQALVGSPPYLTNLESFVFTDL